MYIFLGNYDGRFRQFEGLEIRIEKWLIINTFCSGFELHFPLLVSTVPG